MYGEANVLSTARMRSLSLASFAIARMSSTTIRGLVGDSSQTILVRGRIDLETASKSLASTLLKVIPKFENT